jgi:putative transposase
MEEKRAMIFSNKQDHKISINAGCKYYKISRSSYYDKRTKKHISEKELEEIIVYIFHKSFETWGARRIKKYLEKIGLRVDRGKIAKIMKRLQLVAVVDPPRYKGPGKATVNNDMIQNILARQFSGRKLYEVIVSDVTYLKINQKWYFLCVMLDICSRQILSYAVSEHRDSALVEQAFKSMQIDHSRIEIFHTDRGSEFSSKIIGDLLRKYDIKRSLSEKGCPIDNAVCESLFSTFKREFFKRSEFVNLPEFMYYLDKYVTFYNNDRLHSSLDYKTPIEYAQIQEEIGA